MARTRAARPLALLTRTSGGGDEVMLDDSRLLAERAKAGGVEVSYKMWPGLWHCFQHESPEIAEATQALVEIADFIRRRLDD